MDREVLFHQIHANIREIEKGNLVKVIELQNSLSELAETIQTEEKEKLQTIMKEIPKQIKYPQKLEKTLSDLKEVIEKYLPESSIQNENQENIKFESAISTSTRQEESELYSSNYFDQLTDDLELLRKFYYETKEHLDNIQINLIELEYDPRSKEILNQIFRSVHTIKGSSGFLGLKNYEDICHTIEEIFAKARDGKIYLSKELIDIIFLGIKLLQTLQDVFFIEIQSKEFDIQRLIKEFKTINIFSYVKIMKEIASKLEYKKLGEILQEEGKLQLEQLEKILQKQKEQHQPFGQIAIKDGYIKSDDLEKALKKQERIKKKILEGHYVKVASHKLNTLVDLVGELVINQSILKQEIFDLKSKYKIDFSDRTLNQIDMITSMVKNIVLTLGMLPIRELFNKLKVVARNTAKELNKIVTTETKGEETELDRSVIELLYEPMIHILRNAIDHGIETIEERLQKNKSKTGKIQLMAENKGSEVWITVEDDGRGIQKQKILKKAVEMHVISEENAVNLNERQVYELMFVPGLTTKEETTSISGRGVGLDVVKRAIESLQGKIEIQSKEGEFCRWILKIPLTLAIIDGFVVKVLQTNFVFPFQYIEEVYVFDRFEVLNQEQLFVRKEGVLMPVYFFEEILLDKGIPKQKGIYQSLVIKYENQKVCIVVDEIIGKQEIVIRNLGALVKNHLYAGGTIFGDGSIGFVIDIENLMEKLLS
ncbi:MAG: ATP-binding protein [Leptospiraceae bacterium]|nr:ATP-binding protein [Leptospiraceae bacterium]MDW7975218.1 ATP-binding protein [Leptospiraceae bacterium]